MDATPFHETLNVTQDGSNFYLFEKPDDEDVLLTVTAPSRAWNGLVHDSLEAGQACRKWFVETYDHATIVWL